MNLESTEMVQSQNNNFDSTSYSPKVANKRKRVLATSPKRDDISSYNEITTTSLDRSTTASSSQINRNNNYGQSSHDEDTDIVKDVLHPHPYHQHYSFHIFLAQLMTLWEILCATVLFIYFLEFFDVFTPSRIVCNLTDVVFFMDVLLRYIVARIKNRYATNTSTNTLQQQQDINSNNNWLFIWFVIDLCLSIPYGTLVQNFEVLPVFKIIEIKNNNRRPIVKFFTNKAFRKELFSHLKEHLIQRKAVRSVLSYLSIIKKDRFGLRRIGRIFGLYRIPSRMKMLKTFLENSRQMSWILTSLRGLSFVLRSHILPTPPPPCHHNDSDNVTNDHNSNRNDSTSLNNTNSNKSDGSRSMSINNNKALNNNPSNQHANTSSSSNIRAYTAGILASTSTGNISSSSGGNQ